MIKNILPIIILFVSLGTLAQSLTADQSEGKALFKQGVDLAFNGQFDESLIALDKAVTKYPKSGVYYIKSKVLATLGRYEEAIKVCNEALALKADEPVILTQKANYLFMLQKYNDSLEVAELAVRFAENLPKTYARPYNARAKAHGMLGHYKMAIEDFDKALKLDPNDLYKTHATTYFNRFCPLFNLGRYDEALETCNKAIELGPNKPNIHKVYANKGLALNKLGRYKEALESADKALELNAADQTAIKVRKEALKHLEQD